MSLAENLYLVSYQDTEILILQISHLLPFPPKLIEGYTYLELQGNEVK